MVWFVVAMAATVEGSGIRFGYFGENRSVAWASNWAFTVLSKPTRLFAYPDPDTATPRSTSPEELQTH